MSTNGPPGTDGLRELFEETLPARVLARDPAGYAALFLDSAVWIPAGAPTREGRDAIHAGITQVLADVDIDPTFHATEVVVLPDADGATGYVLGTSREIVTPRAGGPATMAQSRELWICAYTVNGWRIARMIWNFYPPTGPA